MANSKIANDIFSQKINIYIAVEVKKRELDASTLLAFELARNGFRCYLGTHQALFSVIESIKTQNGVFVDKGTLPKERIVWLKEKVEKYVVLDQELSPSLDNLVNVFGDWPSRIYPGTEMLIDAYLCVGDFIMEGAKKYFGNRDEIVHVTGWPRVDIWNKFGKLIYQREIHDIQKKFGNFLLFTPSIGFMTEKKLFQKQIIEQASRSKFTEVIECMRKLDEDKQIDRIVVRPHTSEDIRVWKKQLIRLKKLHVISNGDIFPWIQASSGLIHQGSTTALQAKIMNKPVYFLKTSSTPRDASRISHLADYEIEFKNKSRIENRVNSLPLQEEVNNRLSLREKDSIERISNVISGLIPRTGQKIERSWVFWHQTKVSRFLRLAGLAVHEIKWLLGATNIPPFSHYIPGGIRRADLLRVKHHVIQYENVQFKVVTLNCFEISENHRL